MSTISRRLAKGTGIYGLGAALTSAGNFALIPFYIHYLSPHQYGTLATANALISCLSIVMGLSLDSSLARTYYDHQHDLQRTAHMVSSLFFSLLVYAAAVTAALLAAGVYFKPLSSIGGVPFGPYLCTAYGAAFFSILSLLPLTLLRAREQAQAFVLFNVARFALNNALSVYFVAHLGWGAEGSLLGTLFSSGAFALVGMALLWPWLRFTWHGADVKAALIYSLPLIPHLAFFWVSNLSDRIILGHYRSEAEVGIYSLGYNVGMGMSLLVNAFASSWSPVFFSTMKEAEPDTQPAAIELGRTASHVVAGFTLAALAFALAAPELVQLMAYFAKPAYLKAAPIVPWVILGFWVQALYTTLVVVVYYYKRTGWLPLITGAGAAVNLSLNLWLVPRYGMIAAAIDTVIAFAVSALLTWRLSNRLLHLHFERQRLVLIALSAVALYAVLMGVAWPGIGSGLGAKALAFAAYCAALSLAGLLPRGGLRRPEKR